MASIEGPTALLVRQILSNFNKCTSLWGEIKVLTRSYQSMNTGIFHDASYSLESTLKDGESSINDLIEEPRNQGAFNHGDNASYVALQNVLSNQSTLVSNLDDIKRQLARAYHDQFDSSSKKKAANPPNPEDILDIGRIMSMRDAAQEYITSTSRALKELAQRIESRDTPQPRPRSQREPQRPAMPEYPAPSSPAHARRYPFEEEKPDMPPRPAPQRPARQQQQPPPAPPPQPQEPKSSPPPLPLHPSSPTDNPSPPNPVACASVAGTPGNYCTGALRLQHDPTLTIRDILRIPTSSPSADPAAPLICKYCNLQLGDPSFRDAVFQGQGRGTAMAKQHMLACASLWDRRAMFKCMVCTAENMDSEFSGMEDFKAHLKAH